MEVREAQFVRVGGTVMSTGLVSWGGVMEVVGLGCGAGCGVVGDRDVERMPLRICFWWPLAVATDGARCLRTRVELKAGHVWKKPASIALHHVSGWG